MSCSGFDGRAVDKRCDNFRGLPADWRMAPPGTDRLPPDKTAAFVFLLRETRRFVLDGEARRGVFACFVITLN
jgi:hypothetical protein